MNKQMIKKAFTLVEMLIVVIIIGILMGALLPKLTWAQAKARDTARKAQLWQIKAALTSYNWDYSEFPAGTCVSDIEGALKSYMPERLRDQQAGRVTYWTKADGCSGWVYGYTPITSNWAEKASFVLVANIESFGSNMNYVLSGSNYKTTPEFSGNSEYTDVVEKKCSQGVMSTGSNYTACSSSVKRGYAKDNWRWVWVEFGG